MMEKLESIAGGFIESKILFAACELGVFDHLGEEGLGLSEIASRTTADPRRLEILLDALVAMEILTKEQGRYLLASHYREALRSDSDSRYVYLLRHRNLLFRRWAFLEEIVRGARLPEEVSKSTPWDNPRAHDAFIRAMYAVSHERAPRVVDHIPLEGVRQIADLGGGPGHYLAEMARRAPEATAHLVDLPETLAVAKDVLARDPLLPRIRFVAWDLYQDPPPEGVPPFDLAFMSQVIHGESSESNRRMLGRVFPQIASGGRLVIHENIVEEGRTSPKPAALFAVNMLAMTEGGRTYTEAEVAGWGEEAGFRFEGGERIDERSYLVTLRRPGG